MSLCLFAGGAAKVIAATAFTLSWSHSVEKTRWEEDWRLAADGLELVEARVQGSGAGMDPPEGSVLEDGWWAYQPDLPAQKRLVLAASGATGEGWSLCAAGECLTIGAASGPPVIVEPCAAAVQ